MKRQDKRPRGCEGERSMASHQVELVLLILSIMVVFTAAFALYAFTAVCRMSLDLQEQVAVWGTPIVMRVKFGECHHK